MYPHSGGRESTRLLTLPTLNYGSVPLRPVSGSLVRKGRDQNRLSKWRDLESRNQEKVVVLVLFLGRGECPKGTATTLRPWSSSGLRCGCRECGRWGPCVGPERDVSPDKLRKYYIKTTKDTPRLHVGPYSWCKMLRRVHVPDNNGYCHFLSQCTK